MNASARAFLAKLLSNIDEAIASGFLPPVPEKDACGICDYRAVCGPYEEQRASRDKNRQDERLGRAARDSGVPVRTGARYSPTPRPGSGFATSLDESLIVEASAGTGKTTELVKRIG